LRSSVVLLREIRALITKTRKSEIAKGGQCSWFSVALSLLRAFVPSWQKSKRADINPPERDELRSTSEVFAPVRFCNILAGLRPEGGDMEGSQVEWLQKVAALALPLRATTNEATVLQNLRLPG
jgi:hypothetical protein